MAESSNKLIFVVGMHRSLTSFVASALAKAFGGFIAKKEHLLHGGSVNRPGFFESKRVFRLNDQILGRDDLTWRTVTRSPMVSTDDRIEITDVLQTDFASHPVSVIKDPRLCYMLPHWYTQACQIYDPSDIFILFVLRHPLQVTQSLKHSHNVPFEESLQLWLFHNARALYFLSQFDGMGDVERSKRWCAIDTSDADMRHFSATIKRIQKAFAFGKLVNGRPLRTFKPEEKHFSSVLPEGEQIPASDDLNYAIDLYDRLSAIAKSTGPVPKIARLTLKEM